MTFARPANATAYSPGDVIGHSSPSALFFNFFSGVGATAILRGAHLATTESALSADTDLFLFNSEPTNFADNAVFTPVQADFQSMVASFRFPAASGRQAGSAGWYVPATIENPQPVQLGTLSTGLFGLLVARGAFTPTASSRFSLRLKLELDQG